MNEPNLQIAWRKQAFTLIELLVVVGGDWRIIQSPPAVAGAVEIAGAKRLLSE